ncbi:hypothetical protein K227x_47170 [Rubripirellula lacrimiformis]|uniref:Uncharacterized protein n=1 Tax=Rubripirellula lacrimiformis TaxID=1930273 RepID=A0A517NGU6_9BACT|nr:hypothetical protein K227x_47170 [Rubripirellula lacrimiformis]
MMKEDCKLQNNHFKLQIELWREKLMGAATRLGDRSSTNLEFTLQLTNRDADQDIFRSLQF